MRFVDVGSSVIPGVVGTFVGPVGFDVALFKAHTGYLHFINVCLMLSSSSFNSLGLEQTVMALCVKVLMTLNLAARLW